MRVRALPNSRKQASLRLLVDTGSTYSWIREETLRRLGVRPKETMEITTIEGRKLERQVGDVFMRYRDRSGPSTVVFAQKRDTQVLGLHALEGLAMQVDPTNKRLVKSRSILAV